MMYISVAKTAARWGVSRQHVRNIVASGRIPGAFRIGSVWAIPANAVNPTSGKPGRPKKSPG